MCLSIQYQRITTSLYNMYTVALPQHIPVQTGWSSAVLATPQKMMALGVSTSATVNIKKLTFKIVLDYL